MRRLMILNGIGRFAQFTRMAFVSGLGAAGLGLLAPLFSIRRWRFGRRARSLVRTLKPKHQLDQIVLAQPLQIIAIHPNLESATRPTRKGWVITTPGAMYGSAIESPQNRNSPRSKSAIGHRQSSALNSGAAQHLLLRASRQGLASGKSRLKSTLERSRGPSALNHDQIIVLPLESRGRQIRGAGAQHSPIDLVALEVHRRAVVAFGAYLDGGRLGEVMKDLRVLALAKLGAVEVDANLDPTISGTDERLHDRPVSYDVCGHVDFMPGAVDKCHVNMFEVFCRSVMDDRRRVSCARCQRGEEYDYGNGGAKQVQCSLSGHELARRHPFDLRPGAARMVPTQRARDGQITRLDGEYRLPLRRTHLAR